MAERLKLGQVLVKMGACSAQSVEEALNNQVIYGGTVGTNLLELGLVTELQLATALGQVHGLPFHSGDIAIPPAVVRLMSADLVERTEIIPLRVEDRKLHVLLSDPAAVNASDEVAFATGLKIIPTVAAEERVWSLMLKLYGIERQFRALAVDHPVKAAAEQKATAPAADLMSQEEFDAMYAREADRPATKLTAPTAAKIAPPGTPRIISAMAPPAAPVVAPPVAPVLAPPVAESEEDLPELELLEELEPVVETAPPRAPPPPPPAEAPPLTFAEAEKALAGVTNRDAIAQIVLRYARSKFKRAVLLAIRGGVADGWEGLGEGITAAKVRNLRIRLGTPSVFETVASAQAHYLGPMLKTPENLRFLKALAGGAPKSVFVIPILVRGRVVNALYADNGRGGQVDPDVGELLILAAKISQSYDALLARRS